MQKTKSTKETPNNDPRLTAKQDFDTFCSDTGAILEQKQKDLGITKRVDMSMYLKSGWDVPFHNTLLRVLTMGEKKPNLTLKSLINVLSALDLEIKVLPKKK